MTVNTVQPETVEETTPELTPLQRNIQDLNKLRKELLSIQYDRVELIYVLGHDPKLATAIQTLIEQVQFMKDFIREARNTDY